MKHHAIIPIVESTRPLTPRVIPEDLLTPKQVARKLGIATTALYRSLARGAITHTRIGRLIKIREADVAAYLARHTCAENPKQYARYS
jgi:excisionase family DNA binding protein